MLRHLIILISLLISVASAAQDTLPKLVLVNQHRPSKKITLKTDWDTYFYTATGKHHGEVIALTDSSIQLRQYYKNGKDSTYNKKVRISRRHPEGWKVKHLSLYTHDTVKLLLNDILIVRKPWINKRGWMLIPAYMAVGAVLAVPLLPVAAIANGRDGVRNWLLFEGLMVGIAGPSLFIGTRHKKYVVGEKWQLGVE